MLYTLDSTGCMVIKNDKNQLHSRFYPAYVHTSGTKEWWLNGVRHREKGPAVEFEDKGIEWWLNGKKHRYDAPAIKYANGHEEWWEHGKLHRLDGPAVIYKNGDCEYWEDGVKLFEYKK